jgi:hypothetical protein
VKSALFLSLKRLPSKALDGVLQTLNYIPTIIQLLPFPGEYAPVYHQSKAIHFHTLWAIVQRCVAQFQNQGKATRMGLKIHQEKGRDKREGGNDAESGASAVGEIPCVGAVRGPRRREVRLAVVHYCRPR